MDNFIKTVIDILQVWVVISFGILYATWLFFTAIMRLREMKDAGKLTLTGTPVNYALAMPALVIGLVLDALANWIFFTVIGLELPKPKEVLSTWRMNRWYRSTDKSMLARWRHGVAVFFGVQILDDIDPSGKHIK